MVLFGIGHAFVYRWLISRLAGGHRVPAPLRFAGHALRPDVSVLGVFHAVQPVRRTLRRWSRMELSFWGIIALAEAFVLRRDPGAARQVKRALALFIALLCAALPAHADAVWRGELVCRRCTPRPTPQRLPTGSVLNPDNTLAHLSEDRQRHRGAPRLQAGVVRVCA
jgi:hypothetical protein